MSANLNSWIDLIFGYKQSGKAATDAINRYHPACYFGYPVEQISDILQRRAIETMIKTWGQTPKRIFDSPHPTIHQLVKRTIPVTITFPSTSIHSKILNPKWGNYVGSLDQPPPNCIYTQKSSKQLTTLVSLPTNIVFGLSQYKCLLFKRSKESGMYMNEWSLS